jgi:hypothetical protein
MSNRKEEILEKSRLSRTDEGIEHAEMRGHKTAAIAAFVVAGVPVLTYAILFGQLLVTFALVMIIEAYYTCLHAVAYRLSKKKKYIFITVICFVTFLACAFMFARIAMGLTPLPGLGGA